MKKLENAPQLKTKIHGYYFDISNPEDREEYNALVERLKKTNGECFETCGGGSHYIGQKAPLDVILDASCLFNNQWNTSDDSENVVNRRVFDWAQDYMPSGMNKNIKRGHYLEITSEMREIRDNTVACGYCGALEPAQKGHVFCPHCIGSEYLKDEDLRLTRMLPVSSKAEREPLTEAEREHLVPLYIEAQTMGANTRAGKKKAKQRTDVIVKAEKTIRRAETERDGFVWLLDHGVNVDNCIYYPHTDRFCFGWRSPVSDGVKSKLLDVLCEFPFDYDIKAAE